MKYEKTITSYYGATEPIAIDNVFEYEENQDEINRVTSKPGKYVKDGKVAIIDGFKCLTLETKYIADDGEEVIIDRMTQRPTKTTMDEMRKIVDDGGFFNSLINRNNEEIDKP